MLGQNNIKLSGLVNFLAKRKYACTELSVQHCLPLTDCKKPWQHWPVKKQKEPRVQYGGSYHVSCVPWPASIHYLTKLPALPVSQIHENSAVSRGNCSCQALSHQYASSELLVRWSNSFYDGRLFTPPLSFSLWNRLFLFPLCLDNTLYKPVIA